MKIRSSNFSQCSRVRSHPDLVAAYAMALGHGADRDERFDSNRNPRLLYEDRAFWRRKSETAL